MDLTKENKQRIDEMSYSELLTHWRFNTIDVGWFHGETGDYWAKRMVELKSTVDHVSISKSIGWKK